MLYDKKRFTMVFSIWLVISLGFNSASMHVQAASVHNLHLAQEELRTTTDEQLPHTHAQAAALVDVATGRVLYSENGEKPLPMASTTKIMTAILAIELGNLDDKVKTSSKAYGKEGSSIYLHLGEEMTLKHLLYGMMLRSGNDAATAIAEHIGGSEEGFVFLMNEKAAVLGLDQTQFRNPHGLDEQGHYTSAIDLAKLSAYALRNSTFREIVKTKRIAVPNPNGTWKYSWGNKNKMLRFYEGADGVKTGYTTVARRCLVSSATRNGQQLTAVTLNDGDDWHDHEKMLNYGFERYPLCTLIKVKQEIEGYPFRAMREVRYPLTAAERTEIRIKVKVNAPLSLDYRLGRSAVAEVYLQDQKLATVPLKEK